jgi:hypothetical protein
MKALAEGFELNDGCDWSFKGRIILTMISRIGLWKCYYATLLAEGFLS